MVYIYRGNSAIMEGRAHSGLNFIDDSVRIAYVSRPSVLPFSALYFSPLSYSRKPLSFNQDILKPGQGYIIGPFIKLVDNSSVMKIRLDDAATPNAACVDEPPTESVVHVSPYP